MGGETQCAEPYGFGLPPPWFHPKLPLGWHMAHGT